MSTTPVITVSHLTKKFGKFTALDDVSFSIDAGEVVGFVGANGAGKTTTISSILGFIGATKGSIEVFGRAVAPSSAHKVHDRIGYAAGDMQLPAKITGKQYLGFVLHQYDGDHRERLAHLTDVLKPQLDKKIGDLSRGNKQKIALLAAFVTDPDLIILDEPTSGLDPVMQAAFLDLVKAEQAAGKTIFMSSHYLNEVADACTRVILMRNGQIIQDISAKELLEKSGKYIRIASSDEKVRPLKGATNIERTSSADETVLSFVTTDDARHIQQWLSGVRGLHDVEVSEYNLEGAFQSMYADESEEKRT